jgi:glycosyltransferase involved in cell wall biosynthesis
MKLLLLNYEFPPLGGGASPVSYELAKRLSETGEYDIDVVTMGYKGLPKYEEVNPHFRIHRVKCWRSKKEICHPWEQLTYLISAYVMCHKLLTSHKSSGHPFDICHCHFIIPTGVLALILKKQFGMPYVITSHGSDVLGYNDRFKYLYPFLVGSWKRVLDGAKTIITPSNFLKGEILKVYPSVEKKMVVIPNGIDTEKFKPQAKKNYILSSGRLVRSKGFQYLIQAVSDENIGWEVHIAGDGPMMGELKSLAEKSKTKIVFHGWLDNNGKEYKDLLEQAAIFVLASEKENAPMSILEAMSAGCAIITTNISGSAETVADAGILIEPRDPNQIKDALQKVAKNVSVYQHKSRERGLENFKIGRTTESYKQYLSVCSQELITQENEIGNIASALDYVKSFSFPADSKILDVGCNYGSLVFNLYNLGYKNVFGIEIDKNAIEKGKVFYPEISDNLIVHNANKIPFEGDTFDVVLMFDVIEHIPDVESFLKNEVHHVLKKDGTFVFQTPNKYLNIPWEIINQRSFTKWKTYHCSLQTVLSLKNLLVQSGLNSILIEKGNVLTQHNKNKVRRKMGPLGLFILYILQILPLSISPNLWGTAKK